MSCVQLILSFAVVYFYVSELRPPIGPAAAANEAMADSHGSGLLQWSAFQITQVAFAIVGGFLTANVGSGSDMCLYTFGLFVWNPLRPERALSETALTASSVVVMGILSAVTSIVRALNGGFARKILLCWGADSFVVVLGAPVGALVLTPAATIALRRLFYLMAVVQFVNFTFMEEAFFDSSVAPYVGARVWFFIVPLFMTEIAILILYDRKLRLTCDAPMGLL